jgi:RNA polymerase sigma factor (sigma-70 family)
LLLIKLKQRLRSCDQLEDLRQEVFLRVFRSLRQGTGLRRPECLGAYVGSICNNVVLEYLREKSKAERWDERVEEQRDPGTGVERELVNEEQSRQMRNLMNRMTSKDRFLICAIFLDERNKTRCAASRACDATTCVCCYIAPRSDFANSSRKRKQPRLQ